MSDLMASPKHGVEIAAIDIETDEPVREENGGDFASVCELCEVDIVFQGRLLE